MAKKHPQKGRRWTDEEKHEQERRALELYYAGLSDTAIAERLSAESEGGPVMHRQTATRRREAGLRAQQAHPRHEEYRTEQLADLWMAKRKIMQAIATWSPVGSFEHGPDLAGLASLAKAMIALNKEQALLTGLDMIPPPSRDQQSDDELWAEIIGSLSGSEKKQLIELMGD